MAGRQSSSFKDDINKAGASLAANAEWRVAGDVTAAVLSGRWYNNTGGSRIVKKVHASVTTAPTGATLVVDAKINGTTVFTGAGARAIIAASAFAGSAVPDKTDSAIVVADGQYLTVEVTQVGSTIAGADLVVQVNLA